ncbi:Choline/ethanolaminephosphotransferase [Suhomyces tanzawaensis NRRL Y-17324]|uniref:diacylglycerol cholinephosphotransferase n=1 Tax=Suhomyces tanzawaensis NRRL Y-17324 TaxID=984487 RepID=A0A1E4SCC5_9ASCO|nr:Choline/ethanolaminephosphotransferase [Suhomyces tanzawaensis NRRL Y-17324]ODV77149.1 Choline/ethanolaminephosphotransferase [Suhomyces tanzawaensis NRRL Y-17324]
MGLFIPPNKLENLRLYKYSSEDHSIISKYILKAWWNSFVKIFPLSMAPNVITLLGLVWVLVNLACVFYYDPYLNSGETPRWCYFFYAFGLFMYQTFDGCDGCHARRTGQSGPLGELFDHSIDAINTSLGALVFASVLRMGFGGLLMLSQFATVCNFYVSTWEEYHTHTLYLSQFSGPVEGVLMICCLYIITGILGPDIWNIKLMDLDLSSLGFQGLYQISTSAFYVVAGLGSLYFNIISAMKNVTKYYEKQSKTLAKSKVDDAYLGLLPFFSYYGVVILFVWFYPEVTSNHGFALVLSICFTVAFSVGRIILAHLTLQSFPMIQVPMITPVLQLFISKVLISLYGYDRDLVLHSVSWLGLGITLGIHSVFVVEIITEITTYLDIYALSIKHKRA